jgi:hypothetical protein
LITGIVGTVDFGSGPVSGIYLARLGGSTGAHEWSKGFGGSVDVFFGNPRIGVDENGGIFLSGTVEGTIDLGGGELATGGMTMFLGRLFNPQTP